MMANKIRTITVKTTRTHAHVVVFRGWPADKIGNYPHVTPSSLRRAQRAQLALMEKGGKE